MADLKGYLFTDFYGVKPINCLDMSLASRKLFPLLSISTTLDFCWGQTRKIDSGLWPVFFSSHVFSTVNRVNFKKQTTNWSFVLKDIQYQKKSVSIHKKKVLQFLQNYFSNLGHRLLLTRDLKICFLFSNRNCSQQFIKSTAIFK